MFLLSFNIHYVRDVGVAGSNPVTPTIDFIDIFIKLDLVGSRLDQALGSNWGPVSLEEKIACAVALCGDERAFQRHYES
jgi:hypothetical protein